MDWRCRSFGSGCADGMVRSPASSFSVQSNIAQIDSAAQSQTSARRPPNGTVLAVVPAPFCCLPSG